MKFNELQKIFSEAWDLNARIGKKVPGRFNIIEAEGKWSNENLYSTLITFLLKPNEKHKTPAFGQHFLQILKDKMSALKGNCIERAQKEVTLASGRRIDILIHTDEDEVIILENKIYAADQPQQLDDYYEAIKARNPRRQVFVVYLTPSGSMPSEGSMSGDRVKHLIREQKFSCITYGEEILTWVKDCIKLINPKPDSKNLLRTGLIQFQDSIEGLCGIREADPLKEKMVLEDFFKKHSTLTEAGKRDEIFQFIDARDTITQGVDALVVVQLLSDIAGHISDITRYEERDMLSIQYTHLQKPFAKDKQGEWIEKIIESPNNVGMEIRLGDDLGIGIEFSSPDSGANITFGFMTHSDGKKKQPFWEPAMQEAILNYFQGTFSSSQNQHGSWWWEYVLYKPNQQSSWLYKEIFGQGEDPEWIVKQIAENWFCPLLELCNQHKN